MTITARMLRIMGRSETEPQEQRADQQHDNPETSDPPSRTLILCSHTQAPQITDTRCASSQIES